MTVGTTSFVGQPDAMSEALDSQLKFTESGTGDWWLASGEDDDYYYEADSAQATCTEGEEAIRRKSSIFWWWSRIDFSA